MLASLALALLLARPAKVQGTIDRGLVWAPLHWEDKTVRILIDTAAPVSIFDPNETSWAQLVSGGLEERNAQPLKPFGFKIGQFGFPELGRIPGAKADHTDGILGFDLLKRHSLGIDFATGEIAFWRDGVRDPEAAAWLGGPFTVIPAQVDRQGMHVPTTFGKALVATGYSQSVFPALQLHSLMASGSEAQLVSEYGGGPTKMASFQTERFTVGSHNLGPEVLFGDPATLEGALNPSLFGKRKVIVDFRGQRLFVGN